MKKMITTLSLCFCLVFMANAQYVNIPDANFKTFLQTKYPTAFNGAGLMDTTNSLIVNETQIQCVLQSIADLTGIQYFKKLDALNCDFNNLTSFPKLPDSLTGLICEHNNLTSLPNLPHKLINLDCANNPNLKCLPLLPYSLNQIYLDPIITCVPNYLSPTTFWNGSFSNLPLPVCNATNNANNCNTYSSKYVNIPDGVFREYLIKTYPAMFNYAGQMDTTYAATITSLNMGFGINGIVDLTGTEYFTNLKYLDIWPYSTLVTKFPKLSNTVEYLDISESAITKIPNLPTNLKEFYFSTVPVDTLPTLPTGLQILSMSWKDVSWQQWGYMHYLPTARLTFLPTLPSTLVELKIHALNLTDLPTLPSSLKVLAICSKKTTTIPTLPTGLVDLYLMKMPITCLPKLPSTLFYLNLDSSLNIKCLPNIPSGSTTTLPICNATNNPNNCPTNPLFEGIVYNDNNSNNKLDNGDVKRANAKISLQNGAYTFSNDTGFYQITADSVGSNTITITTPNLYSSLPQSITHNFSSYTDIAIDTFALKPIIIKDSVIASITNGIGRVRPNRQTQFYPQYENVGTTTLNPIMTINFDSTKLSFDSFYHNAWWTNSVLQYPTSFTNTGNQLIIPINNILPGQHGFYVPAFTAKQNLTIGDSIYTTISLAGGTANAVDTSKIYVSNSFDPNDKQSTPELTPQQVQTGSKYIDYIVRFENTGNDTAFDVVIADTLSNLLQNNAVQIVSSSHLCRTTLINGIAYFEFLNINLPDSHVNKIACNGFVRFRILPIQTLALGAIIPNKASIYFDYNKPVVTNTAITVIKNTTLPLRMMSYELRMMNEKQVLNKWTTANEINVAHFNIQRSVNGKDFATIGQVKANNKIYNEYTFTDNRLPLTIDSKLYYRIVAVDNNGKINYSSTQKITFKPQTQNNVLVFPNPSKGKININATGIKQIVITDILGKTIQHQMFNSLSSTIQYQLNKGVYFIKCIMNNNEVKMEKVVVE